MAELLVSVTSAAEAELAVECGVGLIDVKQPARGSLGRADDAVMAAVVAAVAGRCPVSAALGEWADDGSRAVAAGLAYVKWGLAGVGRGWERELAAARAVVERDSNCRVVLAAYADAGRADAPAVEAVARLAAAEGYAVLLVDTWKKDGTTLLDWLTVCDVARVVERCHAAGVRVAVAGSLGLAEIDRLGVVAADWVAVRGAACEQGRRDGPLDPRRVRDLVALVAG